MSNILLKVKKEIFIWISIVLFSALAACKIPGREQEDETNKNMTQLYVQNFKGGFGSEWLNDVKVRFEEKYKDYEFTPGKKGVQIMPVPAKVDGISLRTSNTGNSEVFFNESVYYYDYVKDGYLLDITDLVTTKLTEFGENKSIEDKMTTEQINYYKTKDQKYYGIPHYAGYNGIIYDVDLFDEFLLYFKDDPKSKFIVNETDPKSKGPDGKYGTSDDGMPSTYEEFFMLCNYMVELGITPFVWAGEYYNTYIEKVMYALEVDNNGLEQSMLNYTFKGTTKNIINPVKSSGEYTYMYDEVGAEINSKNGYLLWANEGKYRSLSFFEKIIRNSDYYTNLVFSPSLLYTDSQKDYLESKAKGKPISMILEGCWWENEANDYFKLISDYYGSQYARGTRRFSMMPLPKASESKIGEKSTIIDTHYSLGFIKASIDPAKIDLAKKFLMFCCTDESLNHFTVITNTVKALNYELTEENYNKLTYFGKSVYDLHNSSDIVYPYSTEPIYLNNQSLFSIHNSYGSAIGSKEENHPITYFRAKQTNNAIDYFNGLVEYNKKRWSRVFGE